VIGCREQDVNDVKIALAPYTHDSCYCRVLCGLCRSVAAFIMTLLTITCRAAPTHASSIKRPSKIVFEYSSRRSSQIITSLATEKDCSWSRIWTGPTFMPEKFPNWIFNYRTRGEPSWL